MSTASVIATPPRVGAPAAAAAAAGKKRKKRKRAAAAAAPVAPPSRAKRLDADLVRLSAAPHGMCGFCYEDVPLLPSHAAHQLRCSDEDCSNVCCAQCFRKLFADWLVLRSPRTRSGSAFLGMLQSEGGAATILPPRCLVCRALTHQDLNKHPRLSWKDVAMLLDGDPDCVCPSCVCGRHGHTAWETAQTAWSAARRLRQAMDAHGPRAATERRAARRKLQQAIRTPSIVVVSRLPEPTSSGLIEQGRALVKALAVCLRNPSAVTRTCVLPECHNCVSAVADVHCSTMIVHLAACDHWLCQPCQRGLPTAAAAAAHAKTCPHAVGRTLLQRWIRHPPPLHLMQAVHTFMTHTVAQCVVTVCPQCSVTLQKTGACSHLTCPCGTSVCGACNRRIMDGVDLYWAEYAHTHALVPFAETPMDQRVPKTAAMYVHNHYDSAQLNHCKRQLRGCAQMPDDLCEQFPHVLLCAGTVPGVPCANTFDEDVVIEGHMRRMLALAAVLDLVPAISLGALHAWDAKHGGSKLFEVWPSFPLLTLHEAVYLLWRRGTVLPTWPTDSSKVEFVDGVARADWGGYAWCVFFADGHHEALTGFTMDTDMTFPALNMMTTPWSDEGEVIEAVQDCVRHGRKLV